MRVPARLRIFKAKCRQRKLEEMLEMAGVFEGLGQEIAPSKDRENRGEEHVEFGGTSGISGFFELNLVERELQRFERNTAVVSVCEGPAEWMAGCRTERLVRRWRMDLRSEWLINSTFLSRNAGRRMRSSFGRG